MSTARLPQPHQPPAPRTPLPRTQLRHLGFSVVEFLLVSVPVLLLTLGGVELAQWYHVRHMVDLALVEAARAGATENAKPAAIARAFEQALHPLFVAGQPHTTATRLARTLANRRRAMGGAAPWQIRILRPNARDYALLADPHLAIARTSGLAAIRNDYQFEQQQRRAQASAEPTVFAANTLALHLVYPHAPLIPGMARLLSALAAPGDAYAQKAFSAGLLPMVRTIQLDMASHPVAWPSLADGRVIQGAAANTGSAARQPAACTGWWCTPSAHAPPLPPKAEFPAPAPAPTDTPPPPPDLQWSSTDVNWDSPEDTPVNDPLCP